MVCISVGQAVEPGGGGEEVGLAAPSTLALARQLMLLAGGEEVVEWSADVRGGEEAGAVIESMVGACESLRCAVEAQADELLVGVEPRCSLLLLLM